MVVHFRILPLLFFLGTVSNLYPQELSHQVLVLVAGVTSTGVISYSQTVGETAIEIFNSSDLLLLREFRDKRVIRVIQQQINRLCHLMGQISRFQWVMEAIQVQ
jgi:hypothetical protein